MKRIVIDVVVLAMIVAGCSYYICSIATQRFDFYDMSIFLDAGYRIARGQKIYVDFFYVAGPIHPYLHALSFKLFGFTKTAVLVHLCVVQAVALTTVYLMGRTVLNVAWASAIAILTSLSLFGPIAHPWYDLTAIVFMLLASAAMLASARTDRAWGIIVLPAVSGAMMALAFLSKTNIGAAGGGMMLLGYAILRRRNHSFRAVAAYIAGGAAVLAIVIFSLDSPSAYVQQNFFEFQLSSRLVFYPRLIAVLNNQPYVPLAIAGVILAGAGGRAWRRAHAAEWILFIITWVTGIFSPWTGSAQLQAYCFFLGPLVLYLTMLAASLPRGAANTLERRVYNTARLTCALTIVFLCHFAWMRELEAWTWQTADLDSSYTLQTAAFGGWQCSQSIGAGVDNAVQAINSIVPTKDTLLIMPDCGIIYGLTNHDSYRKVPWAFLVNGSPGAGPLREQMLTHFYAEPPDWILLRNEREIDGLQTANLLHELGLDIVIAQQYAPAWNWQTFKLYQRKGVH